MNLKAEQLLLILLALLTAVVPAVTAEIIYANYEDSFQIGYNNGLWYRRVTGPAVYCDPNWEQAMRFEVSGPATSGYLLDAVKVPLLVQHGGPCPANPVETLNVSVRLDDGGAPGDVIESVQVTAPKGSHSEYSAVFTRTSLLRGGGTYWVVLSGIGNSNHGWCKVGPSVATSSGMYRPLDGEWLVADATDLAFKVEGFGPVVTGEPSLGRVKADYIGTSESEPR